MQMSQKLQAFHPKNLQLWSKWIVKKGFRGSFLCTNAKGKPARKRSDSTRPSDLLPEAWSDMSQVQKKSVEAEYAAKRTLLRRQIAELKSKHADLDFEKLLRITPVGAI